MPGPIRRENLDPGPPKHFFTAPRRLRDLRVSAFYSINFQWLRASTHPALPALTANTPLKSNGGARPALEGGAR